MSSNKERDNRLVERLDILNNPAVKQPGQSDRLRQAALTFAANRQTNGLRRFKGPNK